MYSVVYVFLCISIIVITTIISIDITVRDHSQQRLARVLYCVITYHAILYC